MRRTEWLQETRKMRFEEAHGGWQAGRLTQGFCCISGRNHRFVKLCAQRTLS